VPLEVPWGLVATAWQEEHFMFVCFILKETRKNFFFLAQCYKTFFTGVKDITTTQLL
jgi:hypothetical protein